MRSQHFPPSKSFSCGLDATLRVLAGKWKPLILYGLYQRGAVRYGELKRAVQGVSEKVLIQQLKELQSDGIVSREDFKEIPPRVEYALSPRGQTLAQALIPLCDWGNENMEEVARVLAERTGWHKNDLG
ncbi:helix-turn-helix transcriptional regulator [Sphingomonas sp. AP4-R1]|uniref:winged helix-turn-helix transcriptional regulator n=1 Tax=Sphingomonas sp. AP4-R1 TaxID=2735134 RepID=UPI001493C53C|nr:helix-turn-helix domain-containing protein [Sphingomonas sp. AP4-R1]QJU58248.1 helix-turn-helix transcriptional regulator [Sphingomonas sp. AP4-R1]